MSARILVSYASGTGSTAEVAEVIASEIKQYHLADSASIDVLHVSEIDSIAAYNGVVVGSSIRLGRWLPEAAAFVSRFKDDLREKPTAFFTTCLTLINDTADNRRIVNAYIEPILRTEPLIRPVGIGLFAGSLDPERRAIMPIVGGPHGDYRNWPAIKRWAQDIAPYLIEGDATETPRWHHLEGAILSFTDLSGVDLHQADLQRAELRESDLSAADLEEALLNWADLNQSQLKGANLHRANLIGAVLHDTDMSHARLTEAILNGANLRQANLNHANLAKCDLNWADLSDADLTDCDLRSASLAWTKLDGAKLEGARLEGARYNERTEWPEGFSPEEAGCIRIQGVGY